MFRSTGFAFLLILLAACGSRERTLYVLVDRDHDVRPGASVRMGEERVGEVTAVALASDNQLVVRIVLDPDAAALVPVDSRVAVKRSNLLLGERYLQIDAGRSGEAVASGDTLQAAPDWWEAQRQAWQEALEGIQDPELRRQMESYRRALEAAAQRGRAQWDLSRSQLETERATILAYVEDRLPRLRSRVEASLQAWMDAAERQLSGN